MEPSKRSLRSGEVAQLAGVSRDTVRHYERLGILPESPRTAGGYRMYGQNAVARVQLVRRGLRLGFSLAELAEILKVLDAGGAPCRRVLLMTEEKLRRLAEEIKELTLTQQFMKQLVREWRLKLRRTKPGGAALLLHSLAEVPGSLAETKKNLRRKKR